MDTSLTHKISAILLAFLMLFSSTGFTMDVHYCENQVKGISFLGEAKSCHEKQNFTSSKKKCCSQKPHISKEEKRKCCHNERIIIESVDADATLITLDLTPTFQFNFINELFVLRPSSQVDVSINQLFERYIPPIPDRNTQVLFQVFLI